MMGEAIFEVHDFGPDLCDYDDCLRIARLEISLIGSLVHHVYVCRKHASWAKADLVERHQKRDAALAAADPALSAGATEAPG